MIHPYHVSRRLTLSCFLVLTLASGPFLIFVTGAQNLDQLKPGKAVERELKGGEKHRYPIILKANDYLKLVVEQRGIDVTVRLVGPDGKIWQEVNGPNGTQDTESLSYITDIAGSYTLEIEALEKAASPGRYELQLQAVRIATSQDRAGIDIEKLISEAEQFRRAGKFDQSLPLAQQAVEKSETVLGSEHPLLASSLFVLARTYAGQGKFKQAEPLYPSFNLNPQRHFGRDFWQIHTLGVHDPPPSRSGSPPAFYATLELCFSTALAFDISLSEDTFFTSLVFIQ